jgi:hypothetical protein
MEKALTYIPRAFIPKNLYVKNQDGHMKKVKYVYVTKCGEHSVYPNKLMLEQYYHSNFAVHQITTIEEFNQIDITKTSEDAIALYKEVFNR